jgi:UDPglucose--hexose-1-phosphate uridylyltransferase
MPVGDYEVAVFENLYPSMKLDLTEINKIDEKRRISLGACEVVVFTQDPLAHLKNLETSHIKLILEVLAERTQVLGQDKRIKYVMPFENRGVEMGVTLHHPHGQLYAYPFIPPVVQTIDKSMREHFQDKGSTLLHDMIINELKNGERIILENDHAIAFIPECARYPYETWISCKKPHSWLFQLDQDELLGMADILKKLVTIFDKLWDRTFPYLMIFYQAPLDDDNYDYFHFYIQITPPYRSRERLKYLAGTELGAGVFVNDSLPEDKAAELRSVKIG